MANGRLKIGDNFLKIGDLYLRIGPAPSSGLQFFLAGAIYDVNSDTWSLIGNTDDEFSDGLAGQRGGVNIYEDGTTGGIYVRNAGGSWVSNDVVIGGDNYNFVADIVIDSAGTFYAATTFFTGGVSHNRVLRSDDQGATWTLVFDNDHSSGYDFPFQNGIICTHPTDADTVAIVMWYNNGVGSGRMDVHSFVTTNGGSSWTEATVFQSQTAVTSHDISTTQADSISIGWHDNGNLIIGIAGAEGDIAFTDTNFLEESTDGGATWSELFRHNVGTIGRTYGGEFLFTNQGESHVYLTQSNGIYYDYDGSAVTPYESSFTGTTGGTVEAYIGAVDVVQMVSGDLWEWGTDTSGNDGAIYKNGTQVTTCPYIAGAPGLTWPQRLSVYAP